MSIEASGRPEINESEIGLTKEQLNSLHEKVKKIYAQDPDKYFVAGEFANKIEAEFKEARKYKIFHILIGSTPSESVTINQDFPGDYSIIKFIGKLETELEETKG